MMEHLMQLWKGSHRLALAMALVFAVALVPMSLHAQDDGGDKKEKKEKKEKPAKEPKEKKEKPAKEPKEKKEKPEKATKEKPEKEKKAKSGTDGDGEDLADDDGSGDEKKKKKKKKGKKGDEDDEEEGDEESADKGDGANTANESFHANQADGSVKHGRAVPCARYRRGSMEFIDKNFIYIAIKRKRRKEIQYNVNRGIREPKHRQISRDQKKDKNKSKIKLDKHGKPKDKGNKLVWKIEWTSDCEYRLTFKRSRKATKYEKGWYMDCRITKCYEDYYDCDCDEFGIIEYMSIRKQLTESEIALRAKEAYDDSVSKAMALTAVAEEKRLAAEEAEKAKAKEDEVFGPIKRIQDGNISEGTAPGDAGKKPDDGKGGGAANKQQPGSSPQDKPGPTGGGDSKKPDDPPKEKQEKGAKTKETKEKEPKEKEESSDKTPKEKGDKTPKEKKEKAPKAKKEKAPKEKKEKAPKEKKEKAPKEKKEKPAKEEKDEE